MIIFLFFVFVFLGGLIARMDGNATLPTVVAQILAMSFFVAACIPFAGWWSISVLAGMVGIATGHGQYFLDVIRRYTSPEKVDVFVSLFFGRDPRTIEWGSSEALDVAVYAYGETRLYWRCVFGMFVTGSLVGLPAAILAGVMGAWGFVPLFAATGVYKSASYMAGQYFFQATEPAEWTNGMLRSAACLVVFMYQIL